MEVRSGVGGWGWLQTEFKTQNFNTHGFRFEPILIIIMSLPSRRVRVGGGRERGGEERG